jgi:murein L,D-transpeptidase YafK
MQALRLISRAAFLIFIGVAAFALYDRYSPKPAPSVLAPLSEQIDHILIEKSARQLTIFRQGEAVRSYQIALGFAPAGDKVQQGDGKTPEGIFTINRRNPQSSYHLSLGIDYPQADDRNRAKTAGIDPGGDIFIHGQPNGLGKLATISYDWTAGCIALSDMEIEELWRVVGNGTTVEIRP